MGLGHVGRQMLAAKAAPALNLDFTGGVLDPRITFTRATTASSYDATGTLISNASGAPRFDNDPNSGRFNFIRNNTFAGVVAGTPGTAPTFWTINAPAGITRTIGAITSVGGMNVLPLTFTGTASASGNINVIVDVTTASINQVWTGSAYVQLVSGTFLNGTTIQLVDLTSTGTGLTSTTPASTITAALSRLSVTRTIASATASQVRFSPVLAPINNGDVINVTINIGLPQLERGSVATAPILTSNAALGTGMLPRGLLVEEQRTNLVTNSGPLTDFVATTSSKTAAASQAPDGTFTGVRLVEDTTASVEHYQEFTFTPTANAVYTGSIHVRAAGRPYAVIGLRVASNWVGGNAIAIADLNAGTIAVVSGTATTTIQPAANGWLRIAITATAVAAPSGSSTLRLSLATGTALVNATYTGDGISDVHFWGAGLEIGGMVTSYIPTTAASVTRNADVATMPLGAWFNQANGTLLFEYMLPVVVNTGTAQQHAGDVCDGTLANRYAIRGQILTGTTATFVTAKASAQVASGNMFTDVALVKQKVAVAYSPTGQQGAGIGAAPQSTASATPNGPLTTLSIGSSGAGSAPLDGYITNARYWNYTMTAAQLQNVTT